MDIVSCRNLLIYLGPALQRRVVPVFHYALRLNGFLMLGNTEGLLGAGADLFDSVDKKNKIYVKRAVASPINFGFTVDRSDSGLVEAAARETKVTKATASRRLAQLERALAV